MSLFAIALTFFLVSNPIGNSPAIIAMLSGIKLKRQRVIMFRESLFSMFVALFFLFLGDAFLSALDVKVYTLRIVGGIILFLVGFELIFPGLVSEEEGVIQKEPFFVPIATPLISGPALMAMVMLYSQQAGIWTVFLAICVAWIGVTGVLTLAPYLTKILGVRGVKALERLMGMLLIMMGVQAFIIGLNLFLQTSTRGS